jgi:hypothetical protein
VAAALLLLVAAGGLILFPQPLFAYTFEHGHFRVWSDRPIAPAMAAILDDAERRLARSELYDPEAEFRIFICNEPWRLFLLTRSTQIGGSADPVFTRNIYLREADVAANRLVPPSGELADADVRSLSYFVAHEATHVMQARGFGPLMNYRYPDWLTEGYADFIGKGGRFDLEDNRRLLRAGDPRLHHEASGLYRGYHLMVAYLIERQGRSVRGLYDDPPDAEAVRGALLAPEPG